MRNDALGLFWYDEPPKPKEKKEAVKCVPPDPVWLKPDYLPGLDEALKMDIGIMNHTDIFIAATSRDEMLFDVECYGNYFLASFRSFRTGKVLYFES